MASGFATMSLKAKMLALCVSLCVLSAGIGLTAYWGVQTVIGEYSKLVVYSLPNVQTADEMFLAFRRIRIQLRTLGLTGLPQEAANAAVSEVKNAIDTYEKANQKYAEIPFMDGEQALYDDVNSTWLSFKKLGEEVLRLHATGLPADKEKMLSIFLKDCPDHAKAYTEKINTLLAYHRKNARQWSDDATLKGRNVSQQIALLVIAGSLLDIGVGIFFASSLSKSIRVIATELASGAEQVAQASTQISTSASSLSQATSEQASSLEETVATMEEMTSAVQMNSKNAQQASTQASETEKVATKGADEINLLVGSIEDISADSQKIEEIISVIDDIAFQTNLLALNAAVEAARAGEQGKGFAVVAEAVRSLAQRSAVAAKDISALIQGSVAKIEKGTQQAKQSGQVLEEIVKAVKQVSSLNTEIAAASQEQSQGIEQIGRAMNQMDQVTQQNAAGAEEAAAASEELSAQSLSLNKCVSNLISIIEGARSERGRTASDPAPQKAHAVRSRAA